tara:strand:+ start:280 stop:864 length:585 start_codon:yes stop_codon:yes gene_type:complete
MEDVKLIEKVKANNCNESLKVLINKHSPLCYNIYKKYSTPLAANGVDYDRISMEKDYIIYKSCLSFAADKNTKFSTWLGNYARYHYLNMINENKRHIYVEDDKLNYHLDKENDAHSPIEPAEFREYILNILTQLKDPRVKQVFELRYFSEEPKMTWGKISSRMEVSIQTAINLHCRGLKILKKKLGCKNFEDLI